MLDKFDSYESIKVWKESRILDQLKNTTMLNKFHDEVMELTFMKAASKLEKTVGKPPCQCLWFVTGSGGRMEQGLFSDQDHGLIFLEDTDETRDYFEKFGVEMSYGLNQVGYPYCDGKIMSSNSLWCQSLASWRQQIDQWMEEKSWESIRYLQIFYDSRVLIGEPHFMKELKDMIILYLHENEKVLKRFLDNIQFIRQSMGPLGQLFVQSNGKYQGCIDLKKTAFLPYVNAIRILAISEGVYETSTLARIDVLSQQELYREELFDVRMNFERLLKIRLSMLWFATSYEDVHYLPVGNLTKGEKKELKGILRGGRKIHQFAKAIIEKRCL